MHTMTTHSNVKHELHVLNRLKNGVGPQQTTSGQVIEAASAPEESTQCDIGATRHLLEKKQTISRAIELERETPSKNRKLPEKLIQHSHVSDGISHHAG